MTIDRLEQLHNGISDELGVFPDSQELPGDLDIDRFNNGRQFFKENLSTCVLAMLSSLVLGLSVDNLLQPLVFTNQSNTPQKALCRYLSTVRHVALWHYGNIWDPMSSARRSLRKVYNMHIYSRDSMKENNKSQHFTQFDMSLVQSGFIGLIIMYPRELGLHDAKTHLKDFIYFWKWIGYFLGIQNVNNICHNGIEDAYEICKQIENEIVYPKLLTPPMHYFSMAKAFTDGISLLSYIKLFTPDSVVNFALDMANKRRVCKVSLKDECRIIFLKVIVFLIKHCSWFRKFVNRLTESLIVPKQFIF